MKRLVFMLVCCAPTLVLGCASDPPGAGVCEDAIATIAECTGEAPPIPSEGCLEAYQETASMIAAQGCDAIDTTGGKSDIGGFWCLDFNRWLGLCDELPLSDLAALSSLDDVCGGVDDLLCQELRDSDWPKAADTIRARVEAEDRETVLSDPAVRWYVRERSVSLLAWNVLTARGTTVEVEAGYAERADTVLEEAFPVYDPETFAMARQLRPPALAEQCTSPRAAVVFFPGVVRLVDRNEFDEQSEAIRQALPCVTTERAETGTFVDPSLNAMAGRAAIGRLDETHGALPLHFVGYSQGGRNSLQTLVDHPDVTATVQTVITMNSAAHGSEVADTLGTVVNALDDSEQACDWASDFARPLCLWAAEQSPVPAQPVLEFIAMAMGIPLAQLERFIQEEDGLEAAADLSAFLRRHLPGVGSLSTTEAAEFWAGPANSLPRDVLYLPFRSVVSDRDRNLPASNALTYDLLRRAGGTNPHNDMQVRLPNQALGGPVADLEVLSPVAEGNHWQWELATGAVPENVMPAEMTERIPHRELLVAYYQTLEEVGLLY